MRCAACHHSFDASDDADVPAVCPECGSEVGRGAVAVATAEPIAVATAEPIAVEPIAFEEAEPATAEPVAAEPAPSESTVKPPKTKKGLRQTLNDMVLSLLFVGSIVVAGFSTFVAMRTIKERDELKTQVALSEAALAKVTDAAINAPTLKSSANAKLRGELLGPAINYYHESAWELRKDPEKLDQAVAAYQRSAGLQAKAGRSDLTSDLQSMAELLDVMSNAEYDPARYPSLQQNAMRLTTPLEWGMVTDTSREVHGMKLFLAFNLVGPTLQRLAAKHPEAIVFRDDVAGLYKISGALQALIGREAFAIEAWQISRDSLESLVRDQPGNIDYQTRLVEALTSMANLQKKEQKEEAIANLKRAVEIREQMAQADPEDKALATALTKVKSDLAKLQPAG